MSDTIVTISPKGQITIPIQARKLLKSNKLLFQKKGNTIILNPIEITVLSDQKEEKKTEGLENFHALSEKSFSFWNEPADDIYSSCNAI